MPTLPTQSFPIVVGNLVSGMQGRAGKLLNFAIGSTLRAVAEGFAGVFLWFQAMVLQLLLAIRLSTAVGNDVDTFCADFMPPVPGTISPRLPANPSSGLAHFFRLTPSPSSPVIAIGSILSTPDGLNTFQVIADATYATYSASANGYVLAAGLTDILVPVQNNNPGTAGNIQQQTLTILQSPIVGIDGVTNDVAFSTGTDFESDAALKKRFSDYILGLSRGDLYGTNSAIENTQVGVQWAYFEGYNLDGSYRPGYYFLIVDDGSGSPSISFLQTIHDAADAVRPLGIQMDVFPPTVLQATIALQITTDPSYDHETVVSQVAAVIADNTNQLGVGNDLYFTMVCGWPYTVPGVTDVTGVTINGLTGDPASITTKTPTQDGLGSFVYATVKCISAVVS